MSSSIRLRVFENPGSGCTHAAAELARLIRDRAVLGRKVVLGLATGATMKPFYDELVYLHREEALSFGNVITFNLDEFLGLPAGHPQALKTYMQRHFFDLVDLPPENIHFLTGSATAGNVAAHCAAYESAIKDAGGIDIQMLGIGRNGHIGFNESGSTVGSRTRRVTLADTTRQDAANDFGGIENVPTHAVTVGCGTILEARHVILMAWGARKGRVVRRAINGPVSAKVPASFLRTHGSTSIYLDQAAASTAKPAGRGKS